MPYITREDGERFIIPSYRDVLSAKKPALLKKEVMLLSANYGEYITLQKKNVDQYEAAFSPDPGYLLGESVWHYFKRPRDLIYCEAIPNTTEAILVIVKSGSVYLDGSFPVDSIPDELVVFRTQQNSFDIYIHGDIPISEVPEEGKFALDATSVHSFNILPEPVFPTLPTNKAFQLRLVDVVLKAQGIGVFPVKNIVIGLVILGMIWGVYLFITSNKKAIPEAFISVANPYQLYFTSLATPAPSTEIKQLSAKIKQLYTIPGWFPASVQYSNGVMQANVKSLGMKTSILYTWSDKHNAKIQIQQDGIYLTLTASSLQNRAEPASITSIQQVIAEMIDRLSTVDPGNNMTLGPVINRGKFSEQQIVITFNSLSVDTFALIGEQLQGLPLTLTRVTLNITNSNGFLSGNIILKALGN